MRVLPFFQSAYAGAGFALGAGYIPHVSPYTSLVGEELDELMRQA